MVQPRLQQLSDSFEIIAEHSPDANHLPILEAFEASLGSGATALRSAAWLTADRKVVLHPDGVQRKRLRRQHLSAIKHTDLDSSSCTLEHLDEIADDDVTLHLRVSDDAVVSSLLDKARELEMEQRLRLISDDVDQLASWRPQTSAQLIITARLKGLRQGPERSGADLSAKRVDGIEMYHSDWNGGLVTLFHRFELLTIAAGTSQAREMANLVDVGIDAIRTTKIALLRETVDLFGIGPQKDA